MARLRFFISLMLLGFILGFSQNVKSEFVEDEEGLSNELEGPADEALAKRFKWGRCRRTADCGSGYSCRWGWCYPIQMCTSHRHCSMNSYCDTRDRVCKQGQRSCRSDRHCQSYHFYCKNNKCERKQCFHNHQCPSGQICKRPGVCTTYVQTCRRHNHCKVAGYICINGLCKKRQCYRNYQCPFGHRCASPGICQLRKGYCLEQSHCSPKQCCLKRWNTNVGMCTYLQRPGHWCDTKVKYSCPCVQSYWCKRSGSSYWGTCVYAPTTNPPQLTTVEPTEEPGSGSVDFDY